MTSWTINTASGHTAEACDRVYRMVGVETSPAMIALIALRRVPTRFPMAASRPSRRGGPLRLPTGRVSPGAAGQGREGSPDRALPLFLPSLQTVVMAIEMARRLSSLRIVSLPAVLSYHLHLGLAVD